MNLPNSTFAPGFGTDAALSSNQSERPADLIRRLNQVSVALFTEAMTAAHLNLTPVQFSVLEALERAPAITQVTLAGLVGYDRATLGKVVERLLDKKLIRRDVSKVDRRARAVSLTAKGESSLREARPLVEAMQSNIMSNLSEAEQQKFCELLTKINSKS